MNAPDRFIEGRSLNVPPHSAEAEQSVLGALMFDNDAMDRIADLRATHFYRYDHRIIFDCIAKLIVSGRNADVITVYESLGTAGKADEIGGLAYLNTLVQNTPGSSGIRRWAEIVINRAKLRGLISAADEISAMAFQPEGREVSEIIAHAQAKLEPLADAGAREPAFIATFLTPIIERIDQEFHGSTEVKTSYSTGLRDLDEKLGGGMKGGQLIIVAGRPAMGKSAIALGVSESVADAGATAMFFTQEMTGSELTSRSLSRKSGLALDKILNGAKIGQQTDADWSMLTLGVQRLSELPLLIDETAGISLPEIQARARAAKRKHGLGLIVVDYLGLMAASQGANRTEQVGANSRGLKTLAKQLDIPILLLAQLNRKLEERNNKRPMLSDLRDSGEIEQDADVVLFLYRDEVYNPDSPERGTAEINVAKQRNGPTGIVRAAYFGERTTFSDMEPGYMPELRKAPEKARRGFE
ncbi:replicative DNA helicase [Paraburkholderia sp.]|uniref:replicative DNA helicase n=1 Tax=Paraburkholderia sp. TaxID=1926495 RepID=UPI002392C8D7|nr:replicative DNA helicase [Paraburkholderia sp.]MDE1179472.1 replicative DNA helicase [Paraburkholderia sp.]